MSEMSSAWTPSDGAAALRPLRTLITRRRSSNSVWTPQVPSRTLITRVPGLRPARTSETPTPAAASRVRAASMSATRQAQSPQFVMDLVAAGDRPLHHLDDQIAAAEEHQLAPVHGASGRAPYRGRAARHRAPPPAPGPRWKPRRDRDPESAPPTLRPNAGAPAPVRGKTSARPASDRSPRGCVSSARSQPRPDRGSRLRPPGPASARHDRACDAFSRCRRRGNRCWRAPRPRCLITSRMRSAVGELPAGAISSSVMLSRVNSTASEPSLWLRQEGLRPSSSFIGLGAGRNVVDQYDDVIEAADHGKSPGVFAAAPNTGPEQTVIVASLDLAHEPGTAEGAGSARRNGLPLQRRRPAIRLSQAIKAEALRIILANDPAEPVLMYGAGRDHPSATTENECRLFSSDKPIST